MTSSYIGLSTSSGYMTCKWASSRLTGGEWRWSSARVKTCYGLGDGHLDYRLWQQWLRDLIAFEDGLRGAQCAVCEERSHANARLAGVRLART